MNEKDAIEGRGFLMKHGYHNVRIYKNRRKYQMVGASQDTYYISANIKPNKYMYFETWDDIEQALFAMQESSKL